MRKFIGAALVAGLFCGTAVAQSAPPEPGQTGGVIVQAPLKWLRVTSAEGGFEAEVPSRMARKRDTFENSGMQITQTMLQARRDGNLYYIAFVSFPESLNLEDNAQGVLAGGAEAGAKQIDGKVTETRKFTQDGSPGLEARIVSRDGKTLIVHRGIVRKNRVYQIFVETSPKAGSEKEIARFFNSFVLKPVTKPAGGAEEETYVESDASNAAPSGPVRRSEGALRKEAVTRAVPKYPRDAIAQRLSGDVQVEVLIDETGKVVGAKVLGGPREFHQSSLNTAYQWTFKPFLMNGTAVKVIGVLTFRFSVSG